MQKLKLFASSVLLALSCTCFAQSNLSVTPSIGFVSPLLDGGSGISLALNPAYTITEKVGVEAQLFHNRVDINSGFLSGAESNERVFGLLVGPRILIGNPGRRLRLQFNLLGGYARLEEVRVSVSGNEVTESFGFSLGSYVVLNRLKAGLAFESAAYFVLRAGYQL